MVTGDKTSYMKLGIIISRNDPETAFNALRLANLAGKRGDEVGVFLIGAGVELDRLQDARFDVRGQAEAFTSGGGKLMACGTCLKLRNSEGSGICPLSTMEDLYQLVQSADRVVSF